MHATIGTKSTAHLSGRSAKLQRHLCKRQANSSHPLSPGESVLIMPYMLLFTGEFLNVYTLQQQSQLIGWQISVSAGEKRIIDRATLVCNSNELIGLIGPSGSGKTTLMKCLSGQVLPSSVEEFN